jgi:hypothetical protein
MLTTDLAYLASPYAHPNPAMMAARYRTVRRICADLMRAGAHIFAPIVHCHEIAVLYELPRDHKFWIAYDLNMLKRCDVLLVAQIEGWKQSKGMRMEMEFASERGMPIEFVHTTFQVDQVINTIVPNESRELNPMDLQE